MSGPIKPFRVLKTFPGQSMGTTHEYHQLVECPECGEEFLQDVSTGCFHHHEVPMCCPKCNYPWSLIDRGREKKYGKKTEPFNPSKRIIGEI